MTFFERPPVTIYLLRHGQSEANVDKNVYRIKPDHGISLTSVGMEQAREAGLFLERMFREQPNEAPAIILRSPYERARQTESQVASVIHQHVKERVELPELAEQQYGLFDGVPPDEMAATFPNEYHRYMLAQEFNGRFWARPPQGESLFDVYERVSDVVNMIRFSHRKGNVNTFIMVAHANVLRCFLMSWCNMPYETIMTQPVPANSEIFKIKGSEPIGVVFRPSTSTIEAVHGPQTDKDKPAG